MDIDESSSDIGSEFMELFSESSDDIDELLESMNEQINDQNEKIKFLNAKRTELYFIVLKQQEEIERLNKRVSNLKSILQSNLPEYLSYLIKYI